MIAGSEKERAIHVRQFGNTNLLDEGSARRRTIGSPESVNRIEEDNVTGFPKAAHRRAGSGVEGGVNVFNQESRPLFPRWITLNDRSLRKGRADEHRYKNPQFHIALHHCSSLTTFDSSFQRAATQIGIFAINLLNGNVKRYAHQRCRNVVPPEPYARYPRCERRLGWQMRRLCIRLQHNNVGTVCDRARISLLRKSARSKTGAYSCFSE